jgi:Cys-tRNA(Pro) deacylase
LSSETLLQYLRQEGIHGRILSFQRPTTTVAEAVQALGIGGNQILKSVLFVDETGRPVLALVPGHKRVCISKLETASGARRLRIAREQDVEGYTGYKAGALPPIGHRSRIPTYADHAVLSQKVVYCGGGDRDKLLEISALDVIRISSATVADISE